MGSINKVVILGATGNVGLHIVSALSTAGFHVTAASRSTPTNTQIFRSNVKWTTVDYSSATSLEALFSHQDAIVEAFNPSSLSNHELITDTAIATGIRHIITPDFSSDTFNPYAEELEIFAPKLEAQRYLEAKLKYTETKWTGVIVGPFYDWAIPRNLFWLSPKERTITVCGSGNQKVSMSKIDMCARGTVAVISNPEQFANRPAYFADYTVSTNELVSMAKEVLGLEWESWTVVNVPLLGFFEQAKAAYAKDTDDGVEDRLNSMAYRMLGTYGLFEEGNRYGADFEEKLEAGWQKLNHELMDELRGLLKTI